MFFCQPVLQHIVHVVCGQEHTLCLTKEGGVFSFGAGSYGQLGHGTKNDESLPRKIIELMGTEVTQVCFIYQIRMFN